MRYRFTTRDHPAADGKAPDPKANAWTLWIPLEDGATLELRVGEKSREALMDIIRQEADDFANG